MNDHPTMNGRGVPFIPNSGMIASSLSSEITGQCVPPPPIVKPVQTTWGQSSPNFSQDEMQKQWQSSEARLDMENTDFNVIASQVELKLRLKAETTLGQAAFLPSVPVVKEILASPLPFRQWLLPFTFAATFHDLGYIPANPELFNETIQRKIWSLADELDISKDAPLTVSIQSMFAEQWDYAISLMDIRPYNLCSSPLVIGPHGEALERWEIQLSFNTGLPSYICLPLRAIVDKNGNQYPLHLPLDKYHLLGLDRACLQDRHRYVITPSYTDYLDNSYNNFGGVAVTWLGGIETIEKVDWSPIYNRSVVYAVNPFTFGGDVRACLRCMEAVCKKLADNGCRITLCCPTL